MMKIYRKTRGNESVSEGSGALSDDAVSISPPTCSSGTFSVDDDNDALASYTTSCNDCENIILNNLLITFTIQYYQSRKFITKKE